LTESQSHRYHKENPNNFLMRKSAFLFFLQFICIFSFLPTTNAELTLDETTSENVKNRATEKSEQEAEIEQVLYEGIIPSPKVKLYGHDTTKTIGTKIKDGTVELNDLPFILIYLINFLSKIAGTIAVLMLIWAGMQFIASGLTEAKEQAKNTLFYALIGVVVTFSLAWMLPAFIQLWLTS
jgi:type IV secretion system pilin